MDIGHFCKVPSWGLQKYKVKNTFCKEFNMYIFNAGNGVISHHLYAKFIFQIK